MTEHYEYRRPTDEELARIWDKDIARNPDDPRWVRWKGEYLAYNREGQAATFLVLCDGEPVGQGTLLFSPVCGAVSGRTQLADGKTIANVNALRIEKAHEGKGHISRMMREMERYAAELGCTQLSIGVEAKEARNLGIYLHWGYTRFLFAEEENGELILYYAKAL